MGKNFLMPTLLKILITIVLSSFIVIIGPLGVLYFKCDVDKKIICSVLSILNNVVLLPVIIFGLSLKQFAKNYLVVILLFILDIIYLYLVSSIFIYLYIKKRIPINVKIKKILKLKRFFLCFFIIPFLI